MNRTAVLALALLAALACGGDAAAPPYGWAGTTATAGDTTVVTTERGAVRGSITIDSVEVVFAGEALVDPLMLVAIDGQTLAIADPTQVHLVGTDGAHLGTLGRAGEGPGELNTIGAIGGSGDTVAALDRRNQRFALYRTDGTVLVGGLLAQAEGLANLQRGRVAVRDGELVAGWGSRISFSGEANFGGVSSHLPGAGTAGELARVTGQPYVFNEEALSGGRAVLYGPNPLTAVAPDGRFALTDGVEYCVTALGAGRPPMRICREWTRIPVADAIRNPDYEAIAAASGQPVEMFTQFRFLLPDIEVGEQRNSIDAIRYDREGRLWVQVVDSLVSDVHPFLVRFAGSLGARQVHWDLFGRDGRLLWQLVLPATFTPWDAVGDVVYGLVEQADGSVAVGRVRLGG